MSPSQRQQTGLKRALSDFVRLGIEISTIQLAFGLLIVAISGDEDGAGVDMICCGLGKGARKSNFDAGVEKGKYNLGARNELGEGAECI